MTALGTNREDLPLAKPFGRVGPEVPALRETRPAGTADEARDIAPPTGPWAQFVTRILGRDKHP